MAKLSKKQALFAVEYVRLKGNGTQAAIAAGYSEKTAATIAKENIRKPHIKKRIEELTEKADAE